MPYYIYLLRCENGSLYTGITTDLARRFREHSGEKPGGAKYTAARKPLRFELAWEAPDRAAASRLEYRLKALTHAQKEGLILGVVPEKLELSGYKRAAEGEERER